MSLIAGTPGIVVTLFASDSFKWYALRHEAGLRPLFLKPAGLNPVTSLQSGWPSRAIRGHTMIYRHLAAFKALLVSVVLLVTALSAGNGCSSSQAGNVEMLDQTLAYYHIHLVSNEIHRAAAYVDREIMDEFLKKHDPEQNVYEWEDFSVMSVAQKVTDKGQFNGATAVIKAKVRRQNSITIETKQIREEWKMVAGKWTLVSEEFLGGPQMKFNSDVGKNAIDEANDGGNTDSD